jgi:hypothetical protein
MKLESGTSQDLLPRILAEFSKYRATLLYSNKSSINNYNQIHQINQTLNLATNENHHSSTLLNLYEYVTKLNDCATGLTNELHSYANGLNSLLMPIQFRFFDLFALVAPDFTTASSQLLQFERAVEKQFQFGNFAQPLPTFANPANSFPPSATGLSRFCYSETTRVFDATFEASIAEYIQNLATTSLTKIAANFQQSPTILTSLDEFQPLQICISLGLISTVTALAAHLSIFNHHSLVQLKQNTVNTAMEHANQALTSKEAAVKNARDSLDNLQLQIDAQAKRGYGFSPNSNSPTNLPELHNRKEWRTQELAKCERAADTARKALTEATEKFEREEYPLTYSLVTLPLPYPLLLSASLFKIL